MRDQIKIVGWLHVIWNGLHLLGGLALFLFFAVIEAVLLHARTGEPGDGKIFVMPMEEAIRIRTQESGEEVL